MKLLNEVIVELFKDVKIVLTSMLVVFITLKLTGLIAWSWIWVMAPLWIPALLSIILAIYEASREEQSWNNK